jgi:hypothetical protein
MHVAEPVQPITDVRKMLERPPMEKSAAYGGEHLGANADSASSGFGPVAEEERHTTNSRAREHGCRRELPALQSIARSKAVSVARTPTA